MIDVKSKQKNDLLIIGIVSILVYIFSTKFDFQEKIDGFCDAFERYEIDELMVVAMALVPLSMIYVWRRWQEIRQANQRLGDALDEIEHLRGILPICCHCKKVRDDAGYWHEVESYFSKHLDTSFSHGICNDCIKRLYPEIAENGEKGQA